MKAEEKKILELAKEAEKIFSEETEGVFFGSDFVVEYVTAYKLKDAELKEAREKNKQANKCSFFHSVCKYPFYF